jgi:hypothetical protein
MSYNVANFDQTVHSIGSQGTIQISDGNLGFEGANGVTINSLGDITANAFFGFTIGGGGGGGGGVTPTLQQVTNQGSVTTGDITANAFFDSNGILTSGGGGGGGATPTLQQVTVQGATTDRLMTVSNSLSVTGNIEAGGLFFGNANLLSNIVNSDITPGSYGSGIQIPQIVINSDHRIASITNVPVAGSSGSVGTLQDVSDTGNTTSNSIQFTNTNTSLTAFGNVQVQGYYLGDANLLSNIVNSDVGPATYGNSTYVTQITITDSGRISGVSNVEIQERSNLDQVVNRGNVTSNIVTFGGVVSTGNIEAPNFTFDSTTSVLTIDTGSGGYIARSLQYIKFTENVSKGHPIYISGVEGSHLLGSKADETDSAKMPAIGLASEDYSTNDFGYVVRLGEMISVSQSSVFVGTTPTANKTIYVGSTGHLTVDRPTGSLDLIQNIGIISKVTGNSVNILVQGAGRANDVPNRIITNDANIHQTVTIGGGNLRTDTNLYVTGNVYADQYEGDGGLLSNVQASNVDVSGIGQVVSPDQFYYPTFVQGGVSGPTSRVHYVDAQLKFDTANNILYSGQYDGDANLLSNIVNSDVGPATYGNTTHIAQITVSDTGRITEISNVEIQEQSNLDQVVNRGNVTSNTVQFTNTGVSLQTHGTVHMYSEGTGSLANPILELERKYASNNGDYLGQLKFIGKNDITLSKIYSKITGKIGTSTGGTEDGLLEFACIKAGSQTIVQRVAHNGVRLINETPMILENNSVLKIEETGVDTSHIYQQDGIVNIGNSDTVAKNNVLSIDIVTSNVTVSGNLNSENIRVSQVVGTNPTVSSNIITVDQGGHSYKFFRVPSYPTFSLEGITIQNTTDGCQTLVDIHPISGDLDVFQSFSNGGTGPAILTSLNSNLVINTGNHVMISCVTDLSNTFVNIIGFY